MSKGDEQKPPVNEAARIVNSLFLDSDYEGKDWEAVRTKLIEEFTPLVQPPAPTVADDIRLRYSALATVRMRNAMDNNIDLKNTSVGSDDDVKLADGVQVGVQDDKARKQIALYVSALASSGNNFVVEGEPLPIPQELQNEYVERFMQLFAALRQADREAGVQDFVKWCNSKIGYPHITFEQISR